MKNVRITKVVSVLLAMLIFCSVVFSTNVFAEVDVNDFKVREVVLNTTYLQGYTVNEITGFSERANVEDILTLDFNSVAGSYGYNRLAIGKEAFKDNKHIENIMLYEEKEYGISPCGIETIGEGAFENCTALKNVEVLPYNNNVNDDAKDSLVEICSRAFKGCTSLDDFVSPSNLRVIESEAFAGCTSLKRVVIYENVEMIADDAFENCTDLTIYGKTNTLAHQYAKDNAIPFVSIDCNSGDVWELHNSIMYMNTMLYSDVEPLYPYYVTTNYLEYYFSRVWSNEINKEMLASKKVFENPFATQSEMKLASQNAKNAIHKAELIEEVYRLIKPEFCYGINIEAKHHNNSCWYCAKAICCLTSEYWICDSFTAESAKAYLELENEVYQITDTSQTEMCYWEDMASKIKSAIDGLVFKADADLQSDLNFLTNICDLSIYTPDSVENLYTAIEAVKGIAGTSYMELGDYNFYDAIYILQQAVSYLELNNYKSTVDGDAVINACEKYSEILSTDGYKYTESSVDNLRLTMSDVFSNENRYPDVSPENIASVKEMIMEFERADSEIERIIYSLEQAYTALELKPLGDLNQDGIKSLHDVIYTLKGIVESDYFSEQDKYFADINGDSNVTVLDVVLLQKELLETE